MFDYQTVKLLHHHGQDDWVPMAEVEHGSAAHDKNMSGVCFRDETTRIEHQRVISPGIAQRGQHPGDAYKVIEGDVVDPGRQRRNRVIGPGSATVYGKIESMNPAGSVKDRIALSMIEEAERSGRLKPGGAVRS